jgi:hypothetical protein
MAPSVEQDFPVWRRQGRGAVSVVLLGAIAALVFADFTSGLAVVVLRIIGLVAVAGLLPVAPNGETAPAAIVQFAKIGWQAHAAMWVASFTLASFVLYHAVPQSIALTGSSRIAVTSLSAIYLLEGYAWLIIVYAWVSTAASCFHFAKAQCLSGAGTAAVPFRLSILVPLGSVMLSLWATGGAMQLTADSMFKDVPCALALADSRGGEKMDPGIEHELGDTTLSLVVDLASTNLTCPGGGAKDRYMALGNDRYFRRRAITTVDGSTTWPMSKGEIVTCNSAPLVER